MWIPFIMRSNQSLDSSILDLETLQVLGEPHLEAEDFEHQVCFLQQGLTLLGVLGLDQCLQKVVEVSFDAFAEDETKIAGELAGVIAGPEDQVVGLRDDGEFLVVLSICHHRSLRVYGCFCWFLFFDPSGVSGKAVKETSGKVLATRKPLLLKRSVGASASR